jgi:hypothetical protein
MLNQLELIVQYPEANGGYLCRGFKSLHLMAPTYIAFDGAVWGDQPTASALGAAFCQELLSYRGAVEETSMPCSGGPLGGIGCHALNEPACRKIYVRATATGGSSGLPFGRPSAEHRWLGKLSDPTWEVIPTLPAGTDVPTHVPPEWRHINACFWTNHPHEATWHLLQRVGLSPEDSRVFISYVRKDTSAVADQLFDALTNAGFDVFLDRCSVPVGVKFQERLMQDLCDKAMVVFLNSQGVKNSQWVGEELTIIKLYRLGLLELRLPGGIERPDIDPDFSQLVNGKDLTSAGKSYPAGMRKLSKKKLATTLGQIKDIHGKALHRRRYELIDNFAAALMKENKAAQVLPDGTFLVARTTVPGEAIVNLTPRLPELADYCSLHQRGGVSTGREGLLISPSPFFVPQRQGHITWLSDLSNIRHINEAQITKLASEL